MREHWLTNITRLVIKGYYLMKLLEDAWTVTTSVVKASHRQEKRSNRITTLLNVEWMLGFLQISKKQI